jgi:adenylosuccinate synthase
MQKRKLRLEAKLKINYVDIVCGLAWGDEAKGKITSHLASSGKYDYVCRWGGGNNAGHTVYINNKKLKTHLIPSGVFYGINSIIGPGCVLNVKSFYEEIEYLNEHGFDTSLIKVSPKTHIVTEKHLQEDIEKYHKKLGTTAKGIAPCYSDKMARTGVRADLILEESFIWDEELRGNILCEGAQGFWLDIDYGNYPYVTSSSTLPYSACSLGFPPQKIRKIYGASKVYDTRSGVDPDFPDSLLHQAELALIGEKGQEYGVTTGRRRKVNWLNLDKIIKAINISGTTDVIFSKVDILKEVKLYKLIYKKQIVEFHAMDDMKFLINNILKSKCECLSTITYSSSPKSI